MKDESDSAYLQSVVPAGYTNSVHKAWRGLVTRDGWKWASLENKSWALFDLNEGIYEQLRLALNHSSKAERKI